MKYIQQLLNDRKSLIDKMKYHDKKRENLSLEYKDIPAKALLSLGYREGDKLIINDIEYTINEATDITEDMSVEVVVVDKDRNFKYVLISNERVVIDEY